MPNFKSDNKEPILEAQNEEESLRREHQTLDAMVAHIPECTGIILRMRAIEKILNPR